MDGLGFLSNVNCCLCGREQKNQKPTQTPTPKYRGQPIPPPTIAPELTRFGARVYGPSIVPFEPSPDPNSDVNPLNQPRLQGYIEPYYTSGRTINNPMNTKRCAVSVSNSIPNIERNPSTSPDNKSPLSLSLNDSSDDVSPGFEGLRLSPEATNNRLVRLSHHRRTRSHTESFFRSESDSNSPNKIDPRSPLSVNMDSPIVSVKPTVNIKGDSFSLRLSSQSDAENSHPDVSDSELEPSGIIIV